MEDRQNGEPYSTAQEAAEKEVDALAGESSVSPGDMGALPGKEIADAVDRDVLENVIAEAENTVDLTGTQESNTVQDAIEETGGTSLLPPSLTPEILKTPDDVVVADIDEVVEADIDESGAIEAAEYAGITEEAPIAKKYQEELPITHLKNPENNQIFEVTPELMKRKDLKPCDEDGKLIHDHRRFN